MAERPLEASFVFYERPALFARSQKCIFGPFCGVSRLMKSLYLNVLTQRHIVAEFHRENISCTRISVYEPPAVGCRRTIFEQLFIWNDETNAHQNQIYKHNERVANEVLCKTVVCVGSWNPWPRNRKLSDTMVRQELMQTMRRDSLHILLKRSSRFGTRPSTVLIRSVYT